jgi:tetratricopeptide (TPR) repeat protein
MKDIPRASIRELAHKIKGYGTPRFAFFLGAGASKQSGIPIANEMIRHFKEQIILRCCPDGLKTDDEKTKWLEEQDWYKATDSEYCKCFERFEQKEIGRQRYIESIIEKREPSFGYVVLANLMAGGHISTIITTNFDDLVYSACTTFTGIRPIVYAYGVLASEMRLTAQRPKILKLHGDYLYSVLKNTGTELDVQDPNMMRQLRPVLSEYGLIVVGYGGGDKSIMNVLSDISDRNDLYWCIRRGEKINEDVEKLLRDKGGFLVEIEGFDEMMNEVRRIVGFDVKKMLGSIEERRNQIIKQLEKFDPQYSVDILGEIVDAVKEPAKEVSEDKNITALTFALKAYEAQQANDLPTAEEFYRKSIEIDPKYTIAHNNLGNTLRSLKRYDEAEVAYRKAIEIDPNYATAHNNLGTIFDDLKRYDEAEVAYRKAIEIDPNYALAHYNLGVILNDLKRYDEAEAAYRKSIEIDPKYTIAHNNLGNTLRSLKRYDEAEVAYRKAIEIDPNYALAHNNLGTILDDLKRYDVAEVAYRKSIEIHPNDALAHYNLGDMLRILKRYDEAEVAYRKVIGIDPNDAAAHSNLRVLMLQLGRNIEALAFAESAHLLDPHSPAYLLALASIHKKLGHEADANKYAAQARPLFEPGDWYNRACLESVCGNTDAAIENLKQAAQQDNFDRDWARRDPDFEWIRNDPRFKEIVGEEII